MRAAKDALRMSGKKLKRVAQQRDAHYLAAHGMFMAASAVVKEEAVAVKRLPVKKQLTRKQELAACSKKMRKLDAKRSVSTSCMGPERGCRLQMEFGERGTDGACGCVQLVCSRAPEHPARANEEVRERTMEKRV